MPHGLLEILDGRLEPRAGTLLLGRLGVGQRLLRVFDHEVLLTRIPRVDRRLCLLDGFREVVPLHGLPAGLLRPLRLLGGGHAAGEEREDGGQRGRRYLAIHKLPPCFSGEHGTFHQRCPDVGTSLGWGEVPRASALGVASSAALTQLSPCTACPRSSLQPRFCPACVRSPVRSLRLYSACCFSPPFPPPPPTCAATRLMPRRPSGNGRRSSAPSPRPTPCAST